MCDHEGVARDEIQHRRVGDDERKEDECRRKDIPRLQIETAREITRKGGGGGGGGGFLFARPHRKARVDELRRRGKYAEDDAMPRHIEHPEEFHADTGRSGDERVEEIRAELG